MAGQTFDRQAAGCAGASRKHDGSSRGPVGSAGKRRKLGGSGKEGGASSGRVALGGIRNALRMLRLDAAEHSYAQAENAAGADGADNAVGLV
jgi:hypothetical protein